MSTRLTLDIIQKTDSRGEVIFNCNSDAAFDTHIGHGTPTLQFNKGCVLGSAIVLYRLKHNLEPDPDDYSAFSMFVTEEFVNQLLLYIAKDFITDYVGQEGYWFFDGEESNQMDLDIKEMKEFMKGIDFATQLLIITYM